jgi:tRNA(Ile)-lysidine synthetase-like protein
LPPLDGEHALQAEGQTLLPGWRVTAAPVRGASGPEASGLHYKAPRRPAIETANIDNGTPPSAYAACLDGESVAGPLWVRTRRPGDRFQPLGMAVAKKLQDFMVDDKIPREWRDRVPLVVSPKGIAWVVGWRIADWARVKNTGGRRIELRFSNVG